MNLRTLAAFMICLAAAGTVSAQNVTLRANIPFSFVVDGATLPAGEYTVGQPFSPISMLISETEHGVGAITLVLPTTASSSQNGTARLVFHRYGGQYFLSQVWTDGSQENEIPPSRLERDLAAHNGASDDRVTVALLR